VAFFVVVVGTLVRAPEFEPSILAQQAIAKSEEFAQVLVRPPGFGPGSLAFFPATDGRPLDALLCPRPDYPHVLRPI